MTIESILEILRKYNLKNDNKTINDRLQQVCELVYKNNKTDLKQEMQDLRKVKKALQF